MRKRSRILAATVLFAIPGLAAAEIDLTRENPESAAECDALVTAQPGDLEAYRCFRLIARRHQLWTESVRRLESLLDVDPGNHRARLFLGWIEADRFRARAETLLREAAEGFAEEGDVGGEVRARLGLANHLLRQGRAEEAVQETERAAGVAARSSDAELGAMTRIQKAWNAFWKNDYSTAETLFRALGAELLPDGPQQLQAEVLAGMGAVAWATGRHEEGFDLYRRSAEQYRRMGDLYEESSELYNVALLAARLQHSGKNMTMEEVNERVRRAVSAAQRGGNRGAEAAARLLLAQGRELDLPTRIRETERALALTRETGEVLRHCFALRLFASQLAQQDAERNLPRALALLDEALEKARSAGSLHDVARVYIVRAGMAQSLRSRDEIVADYLAAIDTIEKIRDLQWDELVRARSLWNWAFLYYRASGFLLEPVGRQPTPEDASLAFTIVERLRARLLLDAMDAAHATEITLPRGGDRQAYREVLEGIAAVQRRLRSPGMSREETRAALKELERLEIHEGELGERLARSDPSYARLRRPEIAAIDDVQRLLSPDQAMLAFQLSNREVSDRTWFWNGGSWVFRITRDTVEVAPLPDEDVLEERIAVFLGLIARRDELERDAAARLYEDLLREVLAGLPREITRLVVVPDGALHRLPFGALRKESRDRPLAAEYEICTVPSASQWRHWRVSPPVAGRSSALALADPVLIPDGEDLDFAELRGGPVPLPYSREEAKELARRVGGGSRVLAGRSASEHFVKNADLRRFGILHFATHAIVDDRHPQRSAVLLTPGASEEDGLLQMREVVALDLEDMIVILSACSSVSGELTAGEGVVGLARAFLQAGARAVVGGLWPLHDDEAARLMGELAGHLGRGESVGTALSLAYRTRIEAGAPTEAWAGLVIVGDADLVPVPGGRRPAGGLSRRSLVLLTVLAVGTALAVLGWMRR